MHISERNPKETARDYALRTLRDNIVRLELEPGSMVSENVLASEMEAAAVFTVCQALGARAGAVFTALWNQERAKAGLSNPEAQDAHSAITVALEALRLLIMEDREKSQ